MLSIEIGGKNYYLPQNYSEITLGQYANSESLMKRMPKDISDYINGKREGINLENLENTAFICDYVGYYLDCLTEQLQKAKLFIKEGSEDLGLINLFNLLGFTFSMDDIKEIETYTYGLHKYHLDIERINKLDKFILYDNTSTSDFMEAQLLKTATLQKDGYGISNLPTLVALLYRRKHRKWLFGKAKFETLTYNKIKERAKHFEDMPCDVALGALFFFVKLKLTSLSDFLHSLKETAKEEAEDLTSTAGIQ